MKLKKIIVSTLTGYMLMTGTVLAMPNPMVASPSLLSAEREVGFPALTMTPQTGFHLKKIYVIDKSLIELRYENSKGQKLAIRTATKKEDMENISGIHQEKWEEWNIGCLFMHLTTYDNGKAAAYWNDQISSYAVIAENMKKAEFIETATALYMSINPEP